MCISRHWSVALEYHPNEGQNNPRKSDNRQIRRSFSSPTHRQSSCQYDKVEYPRHQGKGLLGIPVQIRAAGELGGKRTCNDAEREQRKARDDRLLIQMVEKIQGGQL